MPLTSADLLEPTGILTPGLLPGVADVPGRITEWLTAAYADADAKGILGDAARDAYARAFVYHRAYQSFATFLSTNPASATLADQGGHTWSTEQLRAARDNVRFYAAEMARLTPTATEPARPSGVVQTPTDFSF